MYRLALQPVRISLFDSCFVKNNNPTDGNYHNHEENLAVLYLYLAHPAKVLAVATSYINPSKLSFLQRRLKKQENNFIIELLDTLE